MLSTKIRTTVVGLVASAGFLVASVAPAVSQAQWHTYCVSGHCITHTNFTSGGVEACPGINANYNKAYEGLLEAIQTKKEQADKVHPEITQAEAQVHLASIAAFEWGCDVAVHTSPASTVVAPVGAVQASPEGSTSKPLQTITASSPTLLK